MRVALVTPGYFRPWASRWCAAGCSRTQDRDGSTPVVILNEAAARHFFPGEDPLGKRIILGWSDDGVRKGGEVVGIVGDFKQSTLDARGRARSSSCPSTRLRSGPCRWSCARPAIRPPWPPRPRPQVREIDPDLPLYDAADRWRSWSPPRSRSRGSTCSCSADSRRSRWCSPPWHLRRDRLWREPEDARRSASAWPSAPRATGCMRMVVRQGLAAGALRARWPGFCWRSSPPGGMRSLLYEVSATDPAIYWPWPRCSSWRRLRLLAAGPPRRSDRSVPWPFGVERRRLRERFHIPGRRLFRFPWRTAAQVAADVDEELRFHLDLVARELEDAGGPPKPRARRRPAGSAISKGPASSAALSTGARRRR